MYTLLYLKGIANKDLRYSAGNSAHLLCASLDERGVWGRMDTHPHRHTTLKKVHNVLKGEDL